jgi:lauroyl/myristoyl acyltransferase
VSSLLAKQNHVEARIWLQKEGPDKTARFLGHFKRESDTKNFVERLYEAGAVKVIVPDIYRDRDGNEFADCLLVRLGEDATRRKAIRKVCAQLRRRKLGVVQPDEEMGETHLYLSMP